MMNFRSALKAVVLTVAAAAAISCGERGANRTYRVAEGQPVDIGKIKEIDGPVTITLLARNDLGDTLYPVRTQTQCGCTVAASERKPVAPGEDEVITVTYNPNYRPGPFDYEVYIQYIDSPVRTRVFSFKGNVIGYNHPIEEDRPYNIGEGLYMSHRVLAFGSLNPGQTRDMFFRHGNGNTKKADIRFRIPEEWQPYIKMRQPGKMKADERDTIHVKFTMPEGVDTVLFYLTPVVNGKETEQKITVKANKR